MNSELQNIKDDGFEEGKKVNRPQLTEGMTRIMFDSNGKTILDGQSGWDENNWYSYETEDNNKNWANTQTQDGSMWVWIPRFAYKITYTDPNDKSQGGSIDVKFLIGTTDNYYDGDQIKTAQRQKTPGQKIDTTADYTVHPAFTNEKSINYANGGWKQEIRGFWMAKFEAGLPDETTAPKTSYGTDLYYPVYQGQKDSYNYITISQSFLLAKAVSEPGNPYGIANADSHLIKNSEWGAVAYLSYSQYGKTGGRYQSTTEEEKAKEVYMNNVSLNGTKQSVRNRGVYAVTGYAGSTASAGQNTLTSTKLSDEVTGTGTSYAWYTNNGRQASTTGTIYGVYDMSGGLYENTCGYVKNKTLRGYLESFGASFVFKDSTKTEYVGNTPYVMEYPEYASGGLQTALEEIGRYGDGYAETLGWAGDWTNNDASGPFCTRGRLLG